MLCRYPFRKNLLSRHQLSYNPLGAAIDRGEFYVCKRSSFGGVKSNARTGRTVLSSADNPADEVEVSLFLHQAAVSKLVCKLRMLFMSILLKDFAFE